LNSVNGLAYCSSISRNSDIVEPEGFVDTTSTRFPEPKWKAVVERVVVQTTHAHIGPEAHNICIHAHNKQPRCTTHMQRPSLIAVASRTFTTLATLDK
jgi:hypothetical protein